MIPAIKNGPQISNSVPWHSYSLVLCNSFKTGLLPGQNNETLKLLIFHVEH